MAIRVAKKAVAVMRIMVPGKYYTDSIIAAFVLLSTIVRRLTHLLYFLIMVKGQTEYV